MSSAQVIITEIMYDLPGADSGREWIEIYNTGESPVDLEGWKFNDGSNHLLNPPPKNGGTGSLILGSNRAMILADKAEQFLSENGVSVSVIDTVMSLGQKAGTTYVLKLIDRDGQEVSQVAYTTDIQIEEGQSLSLSNGVWIGASPSPGFYSNGQGNGSDKQVKETNNGSGFEPYQYPEKNISTKIISEKIFLSGADSLFRSQSLGIEGQKLEGARHLWNFGDGTLEEGEQVWHNFVYPGEYIVYLDVTSGRFSANDKVYVKVLAPNLLISEANSDFLKLQNNSAEELNISFWILSAGNETFILPSNTYIRSNGHITFPNEVTGLNSSLEPLRLLYPNGKLAYELTDLDVGRLSPAENSSPDLDPDLDAQRLSQGMERAKGAARAKEPVVASLDKPASVLGEDQVSKEEASVVLAAESLSGDFNGEVTEGGNNSFVGWLFMVFGIIALSIFSVLYVGERKTIEGYTMID